MGFNKGIEYDAQEYTSIFKEHDAIIELLEKTCSLVIFVFKSAYSS
jgi:hypothetical protein